MGVTLPANEERKDPIIVRIPKSSISPKKSPKSPKKIQEQESVKISIKIPKQSPVKNLKILPSFQKSPIEEQSSMQVETKAKLPTSKISIQTPPPLALIKNKVTKSPEITKQSKDKEENKEPLVTVLKMSNILSIKQSKDERKARQWQSDLERLLDEENKKRLEERKRGKDVSPVVTPIKKQRLDSADVEAPKSVAAIKKTEIKPAAAKSDSISSPEPKPVPIS